MAAIEIDGVDYPVDPLVAALLQAAIEDRDKFSSQVKLLREALENMKLVYRRGEAPGGSLGQEAFEVAYAALAEAKENESC